MKVENLEMYGKALEMPTEGQRKQMKIVFNLLRKEFGIIGILGIVKGVNNHAKRIRREYPEAVKKARGISEVFEKDLTMMGSLFSAIADK